MKYFNMLMLAAFTMLSVTAFAQDTARNKTSIAGAQPGKINYHCPMHPGVSSDKPGKCPKCGMTLVASKTDFNKKETTKIYTCPMHPEVTGNVPGKCPKCHMQLEEKKVADTGGQDSLHKKI